MKHKRVAVACASILFVAILAVSASIICSVRRIAVDYTSSTKVTTDKILQYGKDLEAYKGKNVFFIDTDKIAEELSGDPYVKILSVKTKPPFTLLLEAEERVESYCVFTKGSYYFIATDGTVLGKKNENAARSDGKPLVVIRGDVPSLAVGQAVTDEDELFNAAVTLLKQFEDGRNQIASITVDRYNEDSESTAHNDWLQINVQTVEGACFTVTRATELTEEKSKLTYSVFKELTGEDRVNANVKIFKGENGSVGYQK